MNIKNIKLIVSEVDGVITDGRVAIDEMSNVVFKNYYLRDFEAINSLKRKYTFCFLSSQNEVNYNLFRKKNIPFFWSKNSKITTLRYILNRYNYSATDLLYIGSSYSDKECLKLAEASVCPADSPSILYTVAHKLQTSSGNGVITELCSLLI